VFTKANLQHGTTPFFADRLKEVPRSIKAFSKTPACITYPLLYSAFFIADDVKFNRVFR
jgi:hypothetical protein